MMVRTNFTMEDKYIRMVRGDTLSFGLQLYDETGTPFGQDLERAYFTCKSNRSDKRYLFQKSLSDGVSKVGRGSYVVRVAPSDTASAKPGKYFYDLEIGCNGDVFTIMRGVLEIMQDVTF
jgi:hypothetical protein